MKSGIPNPHYTSWDLHGLGEQRGISSSGEPAVFSNLEYRSSSPDTQGDSSNDYGFYFDTDDGLDPSDRAYKWNYY
tara:strand:+ start:149 stop:376 length:228 start_codon:yes stop_codon:yes gene_type:complete